MRASKDEESHARVPLISLREEESLTGSAPASSPSTKSPIQMTHSTVAGAEPAAPVVCSRRSTNIFFCTSPRNCASAPAARYAAAAQTGCSSFVGTAASYGMSSAAAYRSLRSSFSLASGSAVSQGEAQKGRRRLTSATSLPSKLT